MKRKVGKINTNRLFEAIGIICKEYNEKHKSDPIVEFSGQFKSMKKQSNIHPLFEQILDAVRPVNAARIKAEKAMRKLKTINVEIKTLKK